MRGGRLHTPRLLAAFSLLLAIAVSPLAAGQEPAAPQSMSAADLQNAIHQLGNLDYDTRTEASRTVRRATPEQAVPALLQAVSEHADGYVRYRALVLLTGFNDPRTRGAMVEAIASPNDRLRIVGFGYFTHNPERTLAPELLKRLDTELAEFVRPALVRALAAHADSPAVQAALVRDTQRGEDFFRSAVIEAVGEFKGAYAFDALSAVARLDGPLQDDAALALGRLGDKRALPTLAELQESAPRDRQPIVAAAICLIGINCGSHEPYVIDTLKFSVANPGFQPLLRSSATALSALGIAGRSSAVEALFQIGVPSREPGRAPIALALAAVALRNTPVLLQALDAQSNRDASIELIAEGFDGLEEDLEKERFFATVRRTYWAAAEGSRARQLMQVLIDRLDF